MIGALKADLRDYLIYQQSVENEPSRNNACGGQLAFKVTSIDVKLTTSTEAGINGSLASKVPIAGVELGPRFESVRTDSSSQDIAFSIEIRPDQRFAGAATTPRPGTFYAALRSTREAMLAASDTTPCMTFTAKQENSITAAFQVKRESSSGIGVSFLIFSIDAGAKQGVATGNTVNVHFAGEGGFLTDARGRRVRARGWLNATGVGAPSEILVLDPDPVQSAVPPGPAPKPVPPR